MSNNSLIDLLKKKIQIPQKVENLMRKYDRGNFCGKKKCLSTIYDDVPYILDHRNKQTMSAPHMHAMALKVINKYIELYYQYQPDVKFHVMDIGCGSG